MAEKKVLIVDDEKPLAAALSAKLTKEGYEVLVASNGKEALAALDAHTFSLMVLDVVMPDVDGFEVLAALKEKQASVPTIVLSNLSQEADEKRALELGATLYLVKSDTPLAELVEKAREIM